MVTAGRDGLLGVKDEWFLEVFRELSCTTGVDVAMGWNIVCRFPRSCVPLLYSAQSSIGSSSSCDALVWKKEELFFNLLEKTNKHKNNKNTHTQKIKRKNIKRDGSLLLILLCYDTLSCDAVP
jgi:hypothetical protein